MDNKSINLVDLDFDSLKSNFIKYLQGQTVFDSYDFTGSGLNVLIDLLSYNTHYNAIYNNLSINEMFIDSARKRNSVVSRAKELGYTPRSATCSKATVNIIINSPTSGPDIVNIPPYQQFSTFVNGIPYTFYNTELVNATGPSTSYTIPNVTIIEGTPLTYSYVASSTIQYIIPNQNVDTTTIRVSVQETQTSSKTSTFSLSDTILNVTPESKVFWLKELDDGLYQLEFGDGIIGYPLSSGSIVTINYMVSSLASPNGARVFNYNGINPYHGSYVSIVSNSSAANGAPPEDIDSIRFNAPRSFTTQDRVITPEDYKSLIYTKFPYAKSVSAWGGEDNSPPIYGKMFLCIKPSNADSLTEQQKSDIILNILNPKKGIGITPTIVDPDYINVVVDSTVYYNDRLTSYSAADIKAIVQDAIINYNNTELQTFDSILRFSKLSRVIDSAEPSIINNITTITLKRNITPFYGTNAEYNINLINPIYYSGVPEDNIISNGFYITNDTKVYYIVDDGVGNIHLFYIQDSTGTRVVVNDKIGTVDYANGIIHIRGLNISSLVNSTLELTIKPSSNDVTSAYTQIVQLSTSDLIVNVIQDKTANSDNRGGNNYQFTTSRT